MNCYTVKDGRIQLGIALSRDEGLNTFVLRLGKREETWGVEEIVALAPASPASHVLVAGGINLMRTTKLMKVGDSGSRFFFGRANTGLKPETADPRVLVLVDFVSKQGGSVG